MENIMKIVGEDLVVKVPEELDHHNCNEIKDKIDFLIGVEPVDRIIFDFANTSFMDSSGIGVIMGRYKKMQFIGGEVCAVGVGDRVHKILVLSGISKFIQIIKKKEEQLCQ